MRSSVPRIGIRLDFDLNATYTTSPSITRKAFEQYRTDAQFMDAVINVPIKDIGLANNPALAMANQVKAALELSGDLVTNKGVFGVSGFNAANDKTLASAFEIEQLFKFVQETGANKLHMRPFCDYENKKVFEVTDQMQTMIENFSVKYNVKYNLNLARSTPRTYTKSLHQTVMHLFVVREGDKNNFRLETG